MKGRMRKAGFTLLEILIVIAVIAVLALITINISRRIENQSKERLTENTIAIINAALTQFKDYGYEYHDPNYRAFVFPLDCNGFNDAGLVGTLQSATGAAVVGDGVNPADHQNEYSGCEAMYYLLSNIPSCRETLDKIDKSLITGKGFTSQNMTITIGGVSRPLLRIIDPWGTTLMYDYYDEWETNVVLRYAGRRTFPVITSAGPDKKFGTMDDINGVSHP